MCDKAMRKNAYCNIYLYMWETTFQGRKIEEKSSNIHMTADN